jgi:Tfp pilus assembly protein PilO
MRLIVNLIILFLIIQISTDVFSKLLPQYKGLLHSLNSRNEERQKFQRIENIKELFHGLSERKDIKNLRLSKDFFEIYLPTGLRDYELIAALDSILRRNGLVLPDLNFTEGEAIKIPGLNLPTIKEVNFILNFKGQYQQTIGLINDLENHSRIFVVKNINLTKQENTLNGLDVNLAISTYYFQPVEIIP